MKALRPLLACAVLAAPAYSQDIAPKDSERDPLLSALDDGTDEDMSSVTVDIRSTAEPMVPEDAGEPVEVKGTLQEEELQPDEEEEKVEHPKDLPAFTREIPLSNGTRIQLSIRPHLLVPDADGATVITVNEPGFEPDKRYAQTATTAAVLGTAIERLDDDSRKMSEAIDRLEQLLGSLPAAEVPRAAVPVPETPNRKQQR